jgi:hypothetical protein
MTAQAGVAITKQAFVREVHSSILGRTPAFLRKVFRGFPSVKMVGLQLD